MNNAVYVLDDHFEIPRYIKNMSSEERKKWITILEKQAIEEAKNIPKPDLLQVWFAQRKSAEIIKKFWEGERMIKPYVLDDGIVEIPEEIRNMSEEEMDRQIAILEAEGRREKENRLTGILWWDVCYSSGGDIMSDIVYVLDDHFEISEKVENMSEEELDRRIAILEQKAIEEAKNLPEPSLSQI